MALAWVHQTRLDAVPRKATRNNLAPNRGADARVAVDEPRLVLYRRTLITSELEAQKAPGNHVLCCCTRATLESLTLVHVRLSIANFQDDVEGSRVGTSTPRTCEVALPACSR